ncbi:MAG: PA0069 family radical SAM protein [Bacteroidetes bacterium]|nr:PA0069 family radical SAM protein [Bacteroidota bacterium]MCW5895987.1 PA0069 family radical SAM protein [Bacteroidota bacterium]
MRDSGTRRGRGSGFNTPNRFEKTHLEPLDIDLQYEEDEPQLKTTFYPDASKSILAKNDSPDLPFDYSLNPYRGCEHGCIYCYARPSHEYLGFSAGLDFESKIMVKLDAAKLLEQTLQKKSWQPQMVAFSGNTDCYQPVERKLQLTRQCLEVFLKFRNPVGLITKNALVLRDIDVFQEMAKLNLIHIMISITSLDADLIRKMESRTSTPINRLKTIEELAKKGIPVGVNAAPIIPGLTDEELPAILKSAAEHGATSAGYILLRLPGAVKPLFLDWLQRELPQRAGKVVSRIKDTRDGELSDSRFGKRLKGGGEIAEAINSLFHLHAKKYRLDKRWSGLSTEHFQGNSGPESPRRQLELF